MRNWLALLLVLLLGAEARAAKTEVRLLLDATTAAPGETVLAGLQMHMSAGWHTYWRNSGDSGGPTEIEWQLPQGITAGPIQWPAPEKFVTAGLTTYVYHDTVVLLVPLSISASVQPGPIEITAKAAWLECSMTTCVKGRGTVKASLTIGSFGAVSQKSADAPLLESWQKKMPQPRADLAARAAWESSKAEDDKRNLTVEWKLADPSAEPDFFPYESKGYEVTPATEKLSAAAGMAKVRKAVKKLEGDWPSQLAGLVVERKGKEAKGFEVQTSIAAATSSSASKATVSATVIDSGPKSLWGALGLAFLGGLILNVMPCVLPVIALKVLGFVQQSRQSPGQVTRFGLIYAGGVLVSFLLLAGLVIGIQAAGRSATWGMQFQEPRFVIVMTTVVTLVALNLFGVFEINLPGAAMGAASDLSTRDGASGAFFNGVLSTVLATPCTAPFLAVALGFAFAQPPYIIVLMFLMIGLGLASPYVVLSRFPSLLRFLPKPGAWMEKFKIAMGFPMIATALWLLSITSYHYGDAGPLWVGLFLVLLAFAVWVWGQFVQRSARRRGLAIGVALLLVGLGYGVCLEKKLAWRTPAGGTGMANFRATDGIEWIPWSAAKVEAARAEGRPVLVDFTAKTCLVCQLNKESSIEIPSVRAKIKATNTLPLIGDFTRDDPAIAAELKRFSRAGVPLVLVYPKDPKAEPIVLPAILTPNIVLSALAEANK